MDFNSFFKVSVATSLWGFIEMVKPQPWPWMRHVAQKRKEKKNNEVLRLNWKVSFTKLLLCALFTVCQESQGTEEVCRTVLQSTANKAAFLTTAFLPITHFTAVSGSGSWFFPLQSLTGVYSSEVCAKATKLLLQFLATGTSKYQLSPNC